MSKHFDKRFEGCNKKIDDLFQGIELNTEMQRQLQGIKNFYRDLYIEASTSSDEELCIETYELFTQGLEGIKEGRIKSKEILEQFEEINFLRKAGIILDNIFKALELLFWATLAAALFTHSIALAPTLVAVNPFFALSVLSLGCMAMIYSVVRFFNCIDEFKPLDNIEKEIKREKNIFQFFKKTEYSEDASFSNVSDPEQRQEGILSVEMN
ncbi:Uncharacterised protein [Legionella wadsworthii]|uniref:DUF5638 domain-containing protein n=1 Tax=Legionella wadsworthii TaxID=28088 RepID=A0A378LR24_9GAMM|nr:DUF5638 domain-containing protein [Legionella wadsworthii]STY29214.1 Uncharacterised protein [Legionella wadsworthii]